MFLTLWVISIIATLYIADQKGFGVVGYFFLALFLGPIAVIIVLLSANRNIPIKGGRASDVQNLQEAKRQLEELQYSLYVQQGKIKKLEALISALSGAATVIPAEKPINPEPVAAVVPPAPMVPVEAKAYPATTVTGKSDMELDFGRNWLSKIGVAVLALGMAFLISYTFKYFGPLLKIIFGFLVGGGLFITGTKLESQEKLKNFGRALLGGAWAIIYFTTYAMYHFEASRVVYSQGIDLFLLSLVVVGMMAHTLRYKSEGLMAVALVVAYLTSTIGQITGFTVSSNLLLAGLVLFVVYKFQWVKILSLGIIMTYAIHYLWVVPNMGISTHDHDYMNFIFLTSYWAVFFLGTHLIRPAKDTSIEGTVAATNFGNIALYSLLAYPFISQFFYAQRFPIILTEGLMYLAAALAMKKLERRKIYVSDIAAAFFAITFSISLKFLSDSALLVWLIEIPFLLFIGKNLKEKVFCYFSYALSVYVGFRLLFPFADMPGMNLWASLSMAACFYLTQRFNKDQAFDSVDSAFDQVFSLAACFYLSRWIGLMVHQPWVAFSLSMQGWAFLIAGALFGLRRFRAYAYAAFIASAGVFLWGHIDVQGPLKWFIVGWDVLSVFTVYHASKYFKKGPGGLFEYEEGLAFWLGLFLLVIAIHQYVFPQWISLSLGTAGVVLILTGFIGGNKIERLGGMGVLALTLGRVVLVDLSGLDIIFKIITLIVLGVLFLGVSYVYNRFNLAKDS